MIENLLIVKRESDNGRIFNSVKFKISGLNIVLSEIIDKFNKLSNRYDFTPISDQISANNIKVLYYKDIKKKLKYCFSVQEYKQAYVAFLKKWRKIMEDLLEESKKYKIEYRDLNLIRIYENNLFPLSAWDFFDIYLPLKFLLKGFNNIKNVYIDETLDTVIGICKLLKVESINIIQQKKRYNLLNFIISKFILLFKLITIRFFGKENYFDGDRKFEDKSIGFLYYHITHRRVGKHIFNFLKNNGFKVKEINPVPPAYMLYLKKKNKYVYKHYRALESKIIETFSTYIKESENDIKSLFLNHFLNAIKDYLFRTLLLIDYLYDLITSSAINLLFVFNDNSLIGKVSCLICKRLSIPTIYFPHGAISEVYLFTFPRWCEIMFLYSDIDMKYLLEDKLNPKKYSDRLIPMGNLNIVKKDPQKLNQIKDIYNKDKQVLLTEFKLKILLGLGISPFNKKIIEQVAEVISSDPRINDILLIIKLHPTDRAEEYSNLVKGLKNISFVFTKDLDITRLIISSELLLTTPSTIILDGIAMKVPTFVLDYYYNLGYYYFVKYLEKHQCISIISNKEGLRTQLRNFFSDPQTIKKEYLKKVKEYGPKVIKGLNDPDYPKEYYDLIEDYVLELLRKSN